jgi:hypothetical protein
MHYLLMLRFPPGEGPQEGTPEYDVEMQRWGALNEEMRAAGVVVAGSGLQVDAGATVSSAEGGAPTVTDGPYAETKEILFSFYILDVPDLEAATSWAAKMPAAEYGSVEVRPTVGFMLV